jgi:hypothetical protein
MPATPASEEPDAPRPGAVARLRALSRAQRELLGLALALLCGVVVMPLLIWVVGNRVLGPYTHGQEQRAGPFALLQDFFVGLVHGSAVFWAVALGPAALILLVRLFLRAMRARG